MQSIAHWLNTIGLGQYAQRFADNDIDASILRDLTDDDLEKIGVSLGHRKRMLRAIVELDEAACAPEPPHRNEAKRRQLTVMFADLVGSTVMSTSSTTCSAEITATLGTIPPLWRGSPACRH